MSAIAEPSEYILAYDRAMCASQDKVAEAYADGHVQVLAVWALRQAAAEYRDINFDLPGG
jgi:hypothetical protein